MILNIIIGALIFLFGVCIGSFLNCVIYRTELQEDMPENSPERKKVSFLRGNSFCPHCKHQLSWKDLFPVFSFLFLKGKCRYCKAKISIQYPLVELATALILLLIFNFQFSIYNQFSISQFLNLAFLFYIASALIVIFVYDLKHYIIPDKVLIPAIIITFIYNILAIVLKYQNISFINYLLAVAIGAGLFLAIFLISKGKAMGFGDVKLAILMGLLLGLPNVLVALFLAFFFGAIIGLILMVFEGKNLKSEIPFGPFLITGTFIAMLWGNQIVNWYLNRFLVF
ncbi:MAG: prepilin peptidase [Candidatus Staskawiczbacteria bacterium]|jgi:prepilin signal peptidase PulO-like enzyme (type II secretory pathway)